MTRAMAGTGVEWERLNVPVLTQGRARYFRRVGDLEGSVTTSNTRHNDNSQDSPAHRVSALPRQLSLHIILILPAQYEETLPPRPRLAYSERRNNTASPSLEEEVPASRKQTLKPKLEVSGVDGALRLSCSRRLASTFPCHLP